MTTPMRKSHDIRAPWTAQTVGMKGDVLDRMERAVAKVRQRLLRATAVLNQAGVPYAVVGGNAVASWVATIDEGAVRTTRKDQVHIEDMIGVGLIDRSWLANLPPELASRLKQILDTPDG